MSDSAATAVTARQTIALPPGYILEGYRVERVLGEGGFGITYLAVDVESGKEVAIKELLPRNIATRTHGSQVVPFDYQTVDAFAWALDSFMNEARTLARLAHPNLVPIHRLFRANSTAYMVMDYVDGHSLRHWLLQHPRPTEDELRAMLMPLLDGLEHVHGHGLLHRDIKPENIFITSSGKPVLLDFGSVRLEPGRTETMTSLVSKGYSPFELYATRSRQTPATDLYSLAAVLIRAITGQTPEASIDRVVDPSIVRPLSETHEGQYSPAFLSAIDAAFAVQAADRPANVAAWRALLNAVVAPSTLPMPATLIHPPVETPASPTSPTSPPEGPAPAPVVQPAPLPPASAPQVPREGKALWWTALFFAVVALGAGAYALFKGDEPAAAAPPPPPPTASEPKAGDLLEVTLAPDLVMKFRYCPPGSFKLPNKTDGKNKQVTVKFETGFWMAQTEVTQAQWAEVMGSNPSRFRGMNLPVEQVDPAAVQGFVKWMNASRKLPEGWECAIPTERQWEYACRAGTTTDYYFSGHSGRLPMYGNYRSAESPRTDSNSPTSEEDGFANQTAPVGSYLPNPWGLQDMHGNVAEMCVISAQPKSIPGEVAAPLALALAGFNKRGGGWSSNAEDCRADSRTEIGYEKHATGFRPVLIRPKPTPPPAPVPDNPVETE